MKQTNVEDYFAHKKEEIYESVDMNEPQKEVSKDSKRSTKLQKFLSLLDHQIEEEMLNFLNTNRKRYEQTRQSQKINLYEDVLFIWSFKKDEADFFNKNKKQNIDKLLAELEAITKKKKVTIKERIEKKLSNLTADELIEYIRNNKDISFDKKHISYKKIESGNNLSSINLSPIHEENALSNLLTNEKQTPSKQRIDLKEKSDNYEQQLPDQKVSCFGNITASTKQGLRNLQTSTNSHPPFSVYKYGTKSISQKMYICYTKQEKHFAIFRKSTFDSFIAKNQVNQQSTSLSNQTIINKIEDKPIIQVCEKNKKQNNDVVDKKILRQQQTDMGVNLKVIEEFIKIKGNESLIEPQRKQSLLNSIQNAKSKANTVLQAFRSSQTSDQNIKNISKVESYINSLQNLRNTLMQQSAQTEVALSDPVQTESNHTQKQQRNDNQSAIETGKKTVSSIESPEKELQTKFEEDNLAEFKKIFYMMNNNISYLKIVQEDKNKYSNYIWSNDQDDLLKNFHFNPNAYKEEMRCLLRYKTTHYALERYQFLQMEVDSKLSMELTEINSNHKESAILNKQNNMQVE